MSGFPCLRCGLCCMHVGEIEGFPEPVDPDGVCSHLDRATRMCKTYDSRPRICRIDEMQPDTVSKADWYRLNLSACMTLIQLHYRIKGDRDATN